MAELAADVEVLLLGSLYMFVLVHATVTARFGYRLFAALSEHGTDGSAAAKARSGQDLG